MKRLTRPSVDDSSLLNDPTYLAYWRREADVALGSSATRGLIAPAVIRVDEDDEGICVWSEEVSPSSIDDLTVSRALGTFASSGSGPEPWSSRHLLEDRLALAGERGTWETLERTPWADLAAELWSRRSAYVGRLSALPAVPLHGDVVPSNLLTHRGDDVVAVDWAASGWGPVGTDLGYFSLSSRLPFKELLQAFVDASGFAATDVAVAARTMAVYTVFGRAAWALCRVAAGEGPLGGKFTHPAVASHVRAVQRQLPQAEALVTG